MKTFAAALFVVAAQAGAAVPASKVCVANEAGFVLKWFLDDIVTGEKSAETDHYPIDQTKCASVADMIKDVKENDVIQPYVDAVWGETQSTDSAIIYKADAGTVTFNCTGTTLNYSCKLNGQDTADEKFANFIAKTIVAASVVIPPVIID